MKTSHILLVILIALLAGFGGAKLAFKSDATTQQASNSETAYERVIRTKTLRCGYFIEAPFTMKDASTNKLTGIAPELAEKVAQELGISIQWAEEISFATFTQDLKNKRYDAVCGSVFILPRAGQVDYTKPYIHVPVYGYVKFNDDRFNKAFDQVDWKNIKIGGLDGEGATTAARTLLPQAQFEILPQSSQISDMLTAVANNKTDIGFVLPTVFKSFSETNPNVLKRAELGHPLYTYGVAFALPPQESGLKNMLDNIVTQLSISNELNGIIAKYDPDDLYIKIKQ